MAHTLFLIGTFGAAAFLGTSITNEVRRRERELADSEQTLARAYDQLEKLDRDKSRFALTVTHELRAPLATATSLLETLSEGYAGPLTERQADLVRRTKGRMEGLRALINDLLDLAAGRTEMTRRRAVPVDVREAVQAAVEGLRGRAESRRVDLAANLTGDPLAVSIDPADLRLALDNLLDNAIKYTPPGGTVRVTVREKERMGEWAEVAVADTGMGIPAEELSRIFDDFYRAANAKAAHADGTGLGLAIVKGIVERYGGHILVESEVGRGSRFEISWPAGQ